MLSDTYPTLKGTYSTTDLVIPLGPFTNTLSIGTVHYYSDSRICRINSHSPMSYSPRRIGFIKGGG